MQLLERHSNLELLLRIVSYIIQFFRNYRPTDNQTFESCAVSKRRQAMQYWIRIMQGAEINLVLVSLSQRQTVRTNRQLAGLNPFIDEKKIIGSGWSAQTFRVGL